MLKTRRPWCQAPRPGRRAVPFSAAAAGAALLLLGMAGEDQVAAAGDGKGGKGGHGAAAAATAAAAAKAGEGGMQVEGTVGELDSAACEKVLAEHHAEIKKCYAEATERLFYLGGRMELKLRIGPSGQPRSVAMISSSVGNYEVEHCVTAVLHKLHFPPPKGGDGELTYPVEFAARTPVGAWPADKVAGELKRAHLGACSGRKPRPGERLAALSAMRATLYVGPGGKVTSVGFSAEEPIDDKVAHCVAGKARALQLDDPLGKMVKVSYDLGSESGE